MTLWTSLCLISCYLTFARSQSGESSESFCSAEKGICDYSFVAFLFNPRVPEVICMGALITEFWVVDNCVDEQPRFTYERIRVGTLGLYNWSVADSDINVYNIVQRVLHKQYHRVKFKIDGYDTRYMYAANNTACLHKTDLKIIMEPGIVGTIKLYTPKLRPAKGDVVYMGKNKLNHIRLHAISRQICDKHFAPYFVEETLPIGKHQICFKTNKISPDECCRSQGLLIYHGKLGGVMGWSTGCSIQHGVDPWVFTLMIFYRQFIRDNTNFESYTAKQNIIGDDTA